MADQDSATRPTPNNPPKSLSDSLLEVARFSVARCEPRELGEVLSATRIEAWARAAHVALQARKIADEPVEDDERTAYADVIAKLRQRADSAERGVVLLGEANHRLGKLLADLATTFESQPSPVSTRIAGRIRRTLEQVAPDFNAEDAGEPLDLLNGGE